jgi:hypothetical protein
LSNIFAKYDERIYFDMEKKGEKCQPRIHRALISCGKNMSKSFLSTRSSQEVKLNENIFARVKRFIQMESMSFIYSEERLKIDDESKKFSTTLIKAENFVDKIRLHREKQIKRSGF